MNTPTLTDIRTRDITADELKAMVKSYQTIRGGEADVSALDNQVVYNRFWFIINAFRRLDLPVDADKTTVELALKLDNKVYTAEMKLIQDGAPAMTVLWSGIHVTVLNADGSVFADGDWRADVRPHFKTLTAVKREADAAKKKEEKVLKAAAAPAKPPKRLKKAKTSKTPKDVEAAVAETTEAAPTALEPELLAQIDQEIADAGI